MYLKNIYLYIYLYFFSFTNVSNQPTCCFRHDQKNSEKTFSLSFTHERKKIPQICEKWKIHNLGKKWSTSTTQQNKNYVFSQAKIIFSQTRFHEEKSRK